MNEKETYEGDVLEVFSGDDLIVMMDLRVESLFKRMRIRLHGVDTPNGFNSASDTDAGKLRQYVRGLCRDKKVKVTPITKRDTYWVATLEVVDGDLLHNVNKDLIAQGYEFKREKR